MKINQVILSVRQLQTSLAFYTEALTLRAVNLSKEYAELADQNGFRIILRQAHSLSYTTTGFSPMLGIEVKDVEGVVKNLQKYGAVLDGEIQEFQEQKIACVQSPDGHMLALFSEKEQKEKEPEQELDEVDVEIRRLLERIQV